MCQGKLISDRVLPPFLVCQVLPDHLAAHALIEAAGVKILRDTVADKGGGLVRSAIRFHEIERLPANPLSLVFGGNIQGLQGDYIGFVYRQVADVLPVLWTKYTEYAG